MIVESLPTNITCGGAVVFIIFVTCFTHFLKTKAPRQESTFNEVKLGIIRTSVCIEGSLSKDQTSTTEMSKV